MIDIRWGTGRRSPKIPSYYVVTLCILDLYYRLSLSSRPESATPLNSRARLTEGAFLFGASAVDPYAGVLFHEPPLVLAAFKAAKHDLDLSEKALDWAWIALDVLTALGGW